MQTTIIAASYNGGVVLGADSRTTTGNYIANRVTDKITPLAENVYICRSGSAADTQAISAYVQWFLAQHAMDLDRHVSVKTAAKLAQSLVYQNKVGHHLGNGYRLPAFHSLLYHPFAAVQGQGKL